MVIFIHILLTVYVLFFSPVYIRVCIWMLWEYCTWINSADISTF